MLTAAFGTEHPQAAPVSVSTPAPAAEFDENNSYKVYIVLHLTRNKSKS